MLAGVIYDFKMTITEPCYRSGDKNEINSEATKRLPGLIAYIGEKKFFFENPTWIDFFFYEIVQFLACVNPNFYTEFPSLQGYCSNVKALPGLAEYLADPNHREATYLFNNKHAKINN